MTGSDLLYTSPSAGAVTAEPLSVAELDSLDPRVWATVTAAIEAARTEAADAAPSVSDHTPDDFTILEQKFESLGQSFQELVQLIEPLRASFPTIREKYNKIMKATDRAFDAIERGDY